MWQVTGPLALRATDDPHSGDRSADCYAGAPYAFTLTQTMSGLSAGQYTASAVPAGRRRGRRQHPVGDACHVSRFRLGRVQDGRLAPSSPRRKRMPCHRRPRAKTSPSRWLRISPPEHGDARRHRCDARSSIPPIPRPSRARWRALAQWIARSSARPPSSCSITRWRSPASSSAPRLRRPIASADAQNLVERALAALELIGEEPAPSLAPATVTVVEGGQLSCLRPCDRPRGTASSPTSPSHGHRPSTGSQGPGSTPSPGRPAICADDPTSR